MEPDRDSPPFWSQPATTATLRRSRRQPSRLLNPVALILAIPILALIILFLVVPPFVSQTSHILKPNSVKKGWDFLNIFLVLFAVLCGVFARNDDDVSSSDEATSGASQQNSASVASNLVNRQRPQSTIFNWMDFPDQNEYNRISSLTRGRGGSGGLRRSSSSYPDLRQESLWERHSSTRFKSIDDSEVNFYQSPPRKHMEPEKVVREIPVDKFEVSSAPAPPTQPKSPAPPPPPPPPASNPKRRRSYKSVQRKENIDERQRSEAESGQNQQPAAPPPPPPPPPKIELDEEEKKVKFHKKKSSGATAIATKEIATAITSLYKAGKKKGNKKVINQINSSPPSMQQSQAAAAAAATPPPPPPPPPPATKKFQNLFKKSGKSKRIHSVATTAAAPQRTPPPPPPPLPPNSIFNNLFKSSGSKSKRFQKASTFPPPTPPLPPPSSILNSLFSTGSLSRRFKNVVTAIAPPPPPPPPPQRRHTITGRPPRPARTTSLNYRENVAIMAPESPLMPIPPPPFRMPEVRFVARGDYVRIRGAHSSRCSSPELEDVDDVTSVKSEDRSAGDPGPGPGSNVTCPSPDVNVKADTFIARLRDEWRLEKMNSINENRNLG